LKESQHDQNKMLMTSFEFNLYANLSHTLFCLFDISEPIQVRNWKAYRRGAKHFKRSKLTFGGQKYTKYNKFNNNSEYFRG